MTDVHDFWTPVYNSFDPWVPVPIEKMDTWFVQRPASPLEALLVALSPDRLPQHILLVGHRSSGKSSELGKLASEMIKRKFPYLIINIDLERNLDIEKVNPVEALFLIGTAVYKIAHEQLKIKPDKSKFDDLVNSLTTLVIEHTKRKNFSIDVKELLGSIVCFGAALFGAPAAFNLISSGLKPFSFTSGTDIETVRRLEVKPNIKQILNCVNAIIEDIQEKGKTQVMLIVDGFDKIQSESHIEFCFAENKHLAELPCRTLYTVPIFVYYHPKLAGVRTYFDVKAFPNVKLHDPYDPKKRDENGYEFMRKVVNARLNSLELGVAPKSIIEPEALDMFIRASAGLLRDLIRLIREGSVKAELAKKRVIDLSVARETIAAIRRDYEAQLNPTYRELLDKVHKNKSAMEGEHYDILLHANLILNYINNEVWFDSHSILWKS